MSVHPGSRASLIALTLLIGACAMTNRHSASSPPIGTDQFGPDTLYFGGDILTMVGDAPRYVQAIAVHHGIISAVGSKAHVVHIAGDEARPIDLHGTTLLPGFIDAHGHFVHYGKNLADAALNGVVNVAEIVAQMRAHAANVPEGDWIVGMGYSPLDLVERRHPTAAELDEVSSDRPVLVVHASGHGGSMNTVLMKSLGITAETPDPAGGEYVRRPRSREPLGPMEETALIAVREHRPPFTGASVEKLVRGAAEAWTKAGHTTAMECGLGLGADDRDILRDAVNRKLLPIDLVVFAKDSKLDETVGEAYALTTRHAGQEPKSGPSLPSADGSDARYLEHVRFGGVKLWLDGNPQNAWMSEPYSTPPPGRQAGFKGYQQIPDKVVFEVVDRVWDSPLQLNLHVLGDAAVEQALRAIEAAAKKHGVGDHRPVFVHAGYVRPDQIARMKAVGAIPTFLTISLALQGDAVAKLWGEERAAASNATRSMLEAGVVFTLSHDAPIQKPAVLPLVWAAVNRVTASGRVLGPDERITPYAALEAVTKNAAYQIREEATKGTLEVGKRADFVVLDKNPLKVEPMQIRDVEVLETIKEGRTVYAAP